MLKVIYYIKAETYPNGEHPIYAKISAGKQSITLSTGKSISKDRWTFTNNWRNALKLEKERVLKQALDLFTLQMEKKYHELLKLDPDISLVELKRQLKGKQPKVYARSVGILEVFDKHNNYFKRKVTAGERSKASLQKYIRAKELVRTFIAKYYLCDDVAVSEITSSFIYNLETYLKFESNFKGKIGIKNNSLVKYFRSFKTVCNHGIKMELINSNPFNNYEGKIFNKEAVFLTQHELNLLENKTFDADRLERVKDIFLFSCYTGYAPVDASNLTSANLIQDNKGGLWIKTNRAKTAIKANVPVLPPTMRTIEKYKEKQPGLIPKLSNQKMNAYLKEIADVCGIKKHLTWYVARHTFATTVTLANGVRIENVSAMLGHTNIRQTQHYAKVLDASVMDDMSKLKDLYK